MIFRENSNALYELADDGTVVTVTHTLSGLSDETSPLSVAADSVQSILIETPPAKTSYIEGEILDLTGMTVNNN